MYLYYYKITNIHNLGCKQRLWALILIISLILIIFEIQPITVHVCIHICKSTHLYSYNRPAQSIIHVPLQVNRFQKSILLIVQYKYLKSCSGDFILQNLILHTRSCGLVLLLNLVGFFISTWPSWSGGIVLYRSCTNSEGASRRGQPLNIFTWFIEAGGLTHLHNLGLIRRLWAS